MFAGRQLVIATKHHKETVIAPPLEAALGVHCVVPAALDTDLLGTFSGEKPRAHDPLTTARQKCSLAMEYTGASLAVASEGSFGPHPDVYFVPAHDELLVFTDKANALEIVARTLTTETNFAGADVPAWSALKAFAERVQFPAHGIILRPASHDFTALHKGITDWETLEAVYHMLFTQYGRVYAETDMRAMYNPTRMRIIAQTTQKLINNIQSCCPACGRPGFTVTRAREGLPCSLCGLPTRSTLFYDYTCSGCGYLQAVQFPKGKTEEDPMYCNNCNP